MSDEINVINRAQTIFVEPSSGAVSVIGSGPPGPAGAPGPQGPQGIPGARGPSGGIKVLQAATPTANLAMVNNANEQTMTTLNIPAQTAAYTLECNSLASAWNSVAGDTFAHRIRVDGVQKAYGYHTHGIVNARQTVTLIAGIVLIPINTACVVTYTIIRRFGTGILTFETGVEGYLTGRLLF
jgi:hypothetical protein